MAKSLRARSKVAARNAKRYNDKSDYAVVQAARLAQTSGRLQEKNKHGKTVAEEDADQLEGTQDDEKMAEEPSETDVTGAETKEDGAEPKKISTSGTRESRRETWRKAKGWKPKQGTKNNGRTKRRR
ncbi:hypothetical protein BDZ90DRAFT_22297 [Jaminaea rosea]|uniref:DUF2423 domain-containing protein n=1 Tax=Jaminaea rosea TaxID=1569628 RepID=A0A316V2E0_9BASI|nr:hypothetical protein BDZ90DRAFT_22297 [Jaminaea rosea]PWN30731.1 hypothetical protein BDZ90DRAFT_22297 [Jaminaea rosea]